MVRVFVGFFVTKRIQEAVEKIQVQSEGFIRGKWVEPQNFHKTFQFIGEVEQEKLPKANPPKYASDLIKSLLVILFYPTYGYMRMERLAFISHTCLFVGFCGLYKGKGPVFAKASTPFWKLCQWDKHRRL